jgi:tRNA (guanine-N7-)-methyltransferase
MTETLGLDKPIDPEGEPQAARIRSFVRRQGRITPGQRKALDELMPRFGLDPSLSLVPPSIFGRDAPVFVEIGFGNGETLAHLAGTQPEHDFIGIEVHPPGVGHLLLALERRGLSNVRVYSHDAVEVLERCVRDASLSGLFVFFPDPWHKKRHQKRRLINPEFVRLAAGKLRPGGLFHAATDWEDYAIQMLEVLGACPALVNAEPSGGFSERPAYRPETKFERRGQRLGHGVWDLVFRRRALTGGR